MQDDGLRRYVPERLCADGFETQGLCGKAGKDRCDAEVYDDRSERMARRCGLIKFLEKQLRLQAAGLANRVRIGRAGYTPCADSVPGSEEPRGDARPG